MSGKLLSLSIGVTKVNFMWCVLHYAQWYWSDNLCKLVTDQWRGSLGVRDSESCWFTEEIVLTCVVEKARVIFHSWYKFVFLFVRFAALHSQKDIKFPLLVEYHPVFPKSVCKNLLHFSLDNPFAWCSTFLVCVCCFGFFFPISSLNMKYVYNII